ncbi:MAG: hypothetical protein K6F95_03065 [Selenomonas sp.]|uniref:hypothetical protein n=1 Tax=Selenomonas sp. TaxID=2053611 RepID=UPI0025DEFD1D|nr:hypothetical protein [Selenomonas sp.]MCR5756869.1 hypothetical protein [Selenomonas sp.]
MTVLEQGYWYTFTSIAALSIFADLGFTTIVLQFAAHEFAYLRFSDSHRLRGDKDHLWRLASFFRFMINWLGKIVSIVFPLIMVGGYYFLSIKEDELYWQIPWLIYSLASAGAFISSALLSFFEGCNSVGLIQGIRFRVGVCQTVTTVSCLAVGLNIYALGIALMVNVLVSGGYIIYCFRQTIKQLWQISAEYCYNWWPEFSALIWRYAVSWCSGYFIFQIFTPIAFYFHGAVFSGKIGISIAMWTASVSIANTWMTAIMPKMNMLISEYKWQDLDTLFNKNLWRTMLTIILGGGAYFVLYFWLHDRVSFFDRVLPPLTMGMLYISWILQSWVNSVAFYLRAHKREPLMNISIISGIWVAVTTYFCARFLPAEYLFVGFLSQYWVVIVVYKIYKKQKQEHLLVAEGDIK